MEAQIIGIKQLHKQLKQIAEATLKGQSFTVVKNSKPVFKIEPIEETGIKKYTLADFGSVQFDGKDKDLSKKIDSILY
ncbi:MAG: hypothetical protein ABIE43_01475 [Patescibacteria group bacterium]